MTYRLLANLCAFAYMDFPRSLLPRLARGAVPIFEVCSALLAHPPCKGLSPELIAEIISQKIRTVLYISCGPDTLARDLKTLTKEYRVETIQPVDMFPMTEHCECVVSLTRK